MARAFSYLCGLGAVLALAMMPSAKAAGPAQPASPYFSRWTVSDKDPVFTARGRTYKTIDIGVCGRDFCGVSVDDRGVCGATLFRFLAIHAGGQQPLFGHGKWGNETKNIEIAYWQDTGATREEYFQLFLGDGHDFNSRDGSMPKFSAEYRRAGAARCFAR